MRMRVYVENAAGSTELEKKVGKHGLSLYNNLLRIESDASTEITVEINDKQYEMNKSGRKTCPIIWDENNKCDVSIRYGTNILKYQFWLEAVMEPPTDTIDNLLRFIAQMGETFSRNQDYGVEALYDAIRTDKVALIIKKTPYTGYDNTSLLNEITKTVPMVMDICSHPKQSLRTEETILDVNLVKRINSRTMEHLSAHSEHWKSRTLNGLIPNRLRAEILEDELNIYENLFFRMAVDDILKYVHKQARSIEKTMEQNDNTINWNAYGEMLGDFKRMQLFQKLLPEHDLQEREEENSKLLPLHLQWSKLERNFSTVESSHFYRSIDKKKHISRNIKPTNILKKDSRYNALYRLWCSIQRWNVQEENQSKGILKEDGFSLNSVYSIYVSSLLLYAFKLLDCQVNKASKFRITDAGEMRIDAVFTTSHMKYIVKSESNPFGTLDITITFVEKVKYEYVIPSEALRSIDDIKNKLPENTKLEEREGKLIFYSKPSETEQRELKTIFHLSNSAKKAIGNEEKKDKMAADKVWRRELEELFSSGKIRAARSETLRINPEFVFLEHSETGIEKYTTHLLDNTMDSCIYLFPMELSEYKKNIKSERILYRLLNYGEKYYEGDAKSWGNYRKGILPVAQSEINSLQRLMKLISSHGSRLQIKWGEKQVVCPICGSTNCSKESEDNWYCKNPECEVLFGKTKHAEGCGESYEWTRPKMNLKSENVALDDTMARMLRKEILFDRLTITDFEFEKQADNRIKYIPVCPKCGKRSGTH